MKRAIAILICVLYLLPSVGYSIDIQWCCNKISGLSFSPAKPAKCGVCATPKRCCRNTHVVVKLKDNQHGSLTAKTPADLSASLTLSHIALPSCLQCFSTYVNYRPPPLLASIYLKAAVLRV